MEFAIFSTPAQLALIDRGSARRALPRAFTIRDICSGRPRRRRRLNPAIDRLSLSLNVESQPGPSPQTRPPLPEPSQPRQPDTRSFTRSPLTSPPPQPQSFLFLLLLLTTLLLLGPAKPSRRPPHPIPSQSPLPISKHPLFQSHQPILQTDCFGGSSFVCFRARQPSRDEEK